jgi:hypothetical protein
VPWAAGLARWQQPPKPAQRVRQLQLVGRELRWLAGRAEPATQTKCAAGAPQHLQGQVERDRRTHAAGRS